MKILNGRSFVKYPVGKWTKKLGLWLSCSGDMAGKYWTFFQVHFAPCVQCWCYLVVLTPGVTLLTTFVGYFPNCLPC
jgi:hypothetical protein